MKRSLLLLAFVSLIIQTIQTQNDPACDARKGWQEVRLGMFTR